MFRDVERIVLDSLDEASVLLSSVLPPDALLSPLLCCLHSSEFRLSLVGLAAHAYSAFFVQFLRIPKHPFLRLKCL